MKVPLRWNLFGRLLVALAVPWVTGCTHAAGNGSAYVGTDGALTPAELQDLVDASGTKLAATLRKIDGWAGLAGFADPDAASPYFPRARQALSGLARTKREHVLSLVGLVGGSAPVHIEAGRTAVVTTDHVFAPNAKNESEEAEMVTSPTPGAPIRVNWNLTKKMNGDEVEDRLGHEYSHWATGLVDSAASGPFAAASDAFTYTGRFLGALARDIAALPGGIRGTLPASPNSGDGLSDPPAGQSGGGSELAAAYTDATVLQARLRRTYDGVSATAGGNGTAVAIYQALKDYDDALGDCKALGDRFTTYGDAAAADYYHHFGMLRPIVRFYDPVHVRFRYLAPREDPSALVDGGHQLQGILFWLSREQEAGTEPLYRHWAGGFGAEFLHRAADHGDTVNTGMLGYVFTSARTGLRPLRRYWSWLSGGFTVETISPDEEAYYIGLGAAFVEETAWVY